MPTTLSPLPPPRQRLVLEGVSWAYYEQTLKEVGEGHLRVTYDRGRMELKFPSGWHERVKGAIASLIVIYSYELRTFAMSLGSVTCRREDLDRGLEPDDCYYVRNGPPVTGDRDLDLSVDRPPDLAIEVDVTHSSVPRQPIYAALGVPEVWRFNGQQLTFLHRQADGVYLPGERSTVFPDLSAADFNRFLQLALTTPQEEAVRAFGEWARGLKRD